MRNLSGKVAVVTGAGHGVGKETALALAAKGCRLAVCDIDEAALEDVRVVLPATTGEIVACVFERVTPKQS